MNLRSHISVILYPWRAGAPTARWRAPRVLLARGLPQISNSNPQPSAGKERLVRRTGRAPLLLSSLAIILLAIILAATGQAAPPSQTPPPTWIIQASPNIGTEDNILQAVAARSASEVWAVGSYLDSSNQWDTLIQHWDGYQWQVVNSPNPGLRQELYGVAVRPDGDAWAVGYYTGYDAVAYPLILRLVNGTWQQISAIDSVPSGTLSAVTAISSMDAWAVGAYSQGCTLTSCALTFHWDGTQWHQIGIEPIQFSSSQTLESVAAAGGDVWAVGRHDLVYIGQFMATLTVHWTNGQWQRVSSPNPDFVSNRLQGVALSASGDGLAVGHWSSHSGSVQWYTLGLRLQSSSWSSVSSSNPGSEYNYLYGVVYASSNDAWAVGYQRSTASYQTLIEEWNGSRWNAVSSPNQSGDNFLYGVAAVAADDVWAVGYYTASSQRTLILHYTSGATPTPTATRTPTPTNTPTPIPTICVSTSQWCTQSSPNNSGENVLNGAVALAQNNVWAVGGYYNTPGGQSLIEHWDGAAWSVTSPVPTVGVLNGVAAASDKDIWAVGDGGIVYYNGTTWSQSSAPSGALNGVAVNTSHDAWAVGDSHILHYDGSWTVSTNLPAHSALYGVAVIAASYTPHVNVWAVGTSNSPSALIMHKVDSGSWAVVANPTPPGSTNAVLYSIDYYHSNVIWAVGSYDQNGSQQTLIEYYDYDGSGTWHILPSPNPGVSINELRHVWVDQQGDVWAVGHYQDYFGYPKTLLVHWNGEQWDLIDSPNPGVASQLVGVTSASGSTPIITTVWAVGSYLPSLSGENQTLVEYLTAPTHSGASTSYYEQTDDPTTYKSQGRAAATNQESGGIILDFGRPRNLGTAINPVYGATTIFSHVDIPITSNTQGSITGLVEDFIDGYEDAGGGGGVRYITVAPGLNNDTSFQDAELTTAHANAWADMTATLIDYIGAHKYPDVYIGAAIDAEPGYSPFSPVETWMSSFSASSPVGLYNFGSTDSYPCPTTFPAPEPCDPTGWTVDQFYQTSWAIPGTFPMPQIYKPIWARWWYIIKRRAYDRLMFRQKAASLRKSPHGGRLLLA